MNFVRSYTTCCCARSCLSEDEVVGTEELTKRPGSDGVHGSLHVKLMLPRI